MVSINSHLTEIRNFGNTVMKAQEFYYRITDIPDKQKVVICKYNYNDIVCREKVEEDYSQVGIANILEKYKKLTNQ